MNSETPRSAGVSDVALRVDSSTLHKQNQCVGPAGVPNGRASHTHTLDVLLCQGVVGVCGHLVPVGALLASLALALDPERADVRAVALVVWRGPRKLLQQRRVRLESLLYRKLPGLPARKLLCTRSAWVLARLVRACVRALALNKTLVSQARRSCACVNALNTAQPKQAKWQEWSFRQRGNIKQRQGRRRCVTCASMFWAKYSRLTSALGMLSWIPTALSRTSTGKPARRMRELFACYSVVQGTSRRRSACQACATDIHEAHTQMHNCVHPRDWLCEKFAHLRTTTPGRQAPQSAVEQTLRTLRKQCAERNEDIPYSRSKIHVWHTFLSFAHVWQTSVFLNLAPLPGHHRNTVNGRVQILHSFPNRSLVMRTYGLSPRQVWQRIGKSCRWGVSRGVSNENAHIPSSQIHEGEG